MNALTIVRTRMPRLRAFLYSLKCLAFAPYYKARHLGRGAFIHHTAQVLGWGSVRIGEGAVISEDCWLNVNRRDPPELRLTFGNYTFVGRRNFFSVGARIAFGDFCLTGADCRFLGSGHIYSDPFVPYAVSGTTDDSSIVLGTNTWLGANVTLLGDVRVGHGSVIGAGSLVTKDLPPFSLAVGSPARIIRRYSIPDGRWVESAAFTAEMEAALPDEATYLARLRHTHPTVKLPVLAAGNHYGDLP